MYHNELDPPSLDRDNSRWLAKVRRRQEEDTQLQRDLETIRRQEALSREGELSRLAITSTLPVGEAIKTEES